MTAVNWTARLAAVLAVVSVLAGCASASTTLAPSATVTPPRASPTLAPSATVTPSGFTMLRTTPATVQLLAWPVVDAEAFAEAACAGTTWPACQDEIGKAVGASGPGTFALFICDNSDGTGHVGLADRHADHRLDDAKLNCPGDRVLRFVQWQ